MGITPFLGFGGGGAWQSWSPPWMGGVTDDEFFDNYRKVCFFIARDLEGLVPLWQIGNEWYSRAFAGPLKMPRACELVFHSARGLKEANPSLLVGTNMGGINHAYYMLGRLYGDARKRDLDYCGVDQYFGTWRGGGPETWDELIPEWAEITGSIVVQQSGAEGKPITFDGNTGGKFDTGRAIVDGSEPLTGWRKCASAEECRGNPNWKNIWWTEVPYAIADPLQANLYDGQNPVDVAQAPRPKYLYWPDPATECFYFDPSKATTTSIQDEKNLVQTRKDAWDGAVVQIRSTDYWINVRATGFDPATHTISFQEYKRILGRGERRNSRGEGYYALMNALVILNGPGQNVVRGDDQKSKIYLWPAQGGEPSDITITRRRCGFNLNGQSHVTVEGFLIQKFANPRGSGGGAVIDLERKPNGGLVIRNNIVRACNKTLTSGKSGVIFLTGQKGSLVEGNQIHDNRDSVGIEIQYGAGHILKGNTLRRNGGVSILLWVDAKDCQVIGNTITDNTPDYLDAHSPVGILLYRGCSNILIKGNYVMNNGQRPLALYSPHSDITIACNVFRHRGPYVIEGFGDCKNIRVLNNVAICDNPNGRVFKWVYSDAIIQNNIFVSARDKPGPGTTFRLDNSHNLHTAPAHLGDIFADPEHGDYRLKAGSPAIDAGVDVDLKEDCVGTKVPQGKAPDIGAYEFTPPPAEGGE